MKWKKLFFKLKQFLLYETNIDLRTTNLLLNIFIESISTTNYTRFKTEIDYLLTFNTKQLSLDSTIEKLNLKILEKELNKLNGDKPK